MSRVIALCLALGFVVLTGFGCMKCGQNVSQKIAEKAIEGAVNKTTGGKASINVGSDVDLSSLPAFLQYPGASAKGRYSMSGQQGTGSVYVFETKDPSASVVDYYKKALAGWKNASTMENAEATILSYGTEDQKQAVTLTVATDKDTHLTSLTILYSKKD